MRMAELRINYFADFLAECKESEIKARKASDTVQKPLCSLCNEPPCKGKRIINCSASNCINIVHYKCLKKIQQGDLSTWFCDLHKSC